MNAVARKKTPKPLRGPALAVAAMNQIIRHPETWMQSYWDCGSSHCFGGWCIALSHEPHSLNMNYTKFDHAKDLLGIDEDESATYVFYAYRRLPTIYQWVKDFIKGQDIGRSKLLPLPKASKK